MPTGYTAKLHEGEQSFEDFMTHCIRAMGVLAHMREEPNDAPIPETIEPSNWYREELESAQADLIRLESMSDPQKKNYFEESSSDIIKDHREHITKNDVINTRLRGMIESVSNWNPPTNEHQGVKDFALNQLQISMESSDYYVDGIVKKVAANIDELFSAAVDKAKQDIEYHTKHDREERERAAGNTEFLRSYMKSIKEYTPRV